LALIPKILPRFKTGPRDRELVNWLIKTDPELARKFEKLGRVYRALKSGSGWNRVVGDGRLEERPRYLESETQKNGRRPPHACEL